MNIIFKYIFFVVVLLLWGCSSGVGDSPVVPGVEDDEEVTVTFSTGNSTAVTRTAFPNGTLVKVYVFRRPSSSSEANLSAAPYKVAEGYTSGTTEGGLSGVTFTGGDITEDKRLTVRSGYKYDFVAVVNASTGAKISDMGALSSGMLTGFTHGSDILSGRKEGVEVAPGAIVNVTFTEYGAEAGNLPHLCSAVCTEAHATQLLIDYLIEEGGSFKYAVSGMDFKQCLPRSANLPFGGNPMALSVQAAGYTTSYSVSALGDEQTVTDISDVAASDIVVILPYPSRYADADKTYNIMNIDFRLRVNGGEVIFSAVGVQTPAFEPGYRYRFIVELDKDPDVVEGKVNLLLSIEPWSSAGWESGMGGQDETVNKLVVGLGSWSSVSWQSGMGGGSTGSMIITSVAGWRSTSWTSIMGEDDNDGES